MDSIPKFSNHIKKEVKLSDISNGQEAVPVSFANDYNYDPLPKSSYTKELIVPESLHSLFKETKGCTCYDLCAENCSCVSASGPTTRTYESTGLMTDEFREFLKSDIVIQECSPMCSCSCSMKTCGNRVAQHPLKTRLEVYYVNPLKRFGVRTLQKLKESQFVMEYTGKLMLDEENEDYDYGFQVELDGINYVVRTEAHSNASCFMNHSCDCNLYAAKVIWDSKRIPHICFYARRDIDEGEELTIDYGQLFWDVKLQELVICHCGEKECRYNNPMSMNEK